MRFIVLLAATSLLVFAGDPDFSGTWKLNSSRSARNTLSEPAAGVLNIEHKGNQIRCTATSGADLPPMSWSFTTDRKETKYRIGTTSRNTAVKWEGDVLLINTIVNGRDRSYTVMDRWKLSRDGRTLKIEREIESAGGETEGTFIYERQD